MFFFHEGLPGSGKSYEAVVKHIVPALAKGRPVDAYIEGLNHEKLADLAGIDIDTCKSLLVVLAREDVSNIHKLTRDNSLVVLDEMQNFWPSDKRKLSPELTQFITEHRHRGQDVLGMGQDIRDIHALWRRRCAQKIVFSKLDGLGREGNYSVRLYKATGPDKYELVTKTVGKYDEKFFGSYASHVATDTNTENYKDKRATIWNSWTFKIALPGLAVVVAISLYFIFSVFSDEKSLVKLPVSKGSVQPTPNIVPASSIDAPSKSDQIPLVLDKSETYIDKLNKDWRPRLAAVIEGQDGRTVGLVEWYDESYRKRESLTFEQIRLLGVMVRYVANQVFLDRIGSKTVVVTSWPIDLVGRVPHRTNEAISGFPS